MTSIRRKTTAVLATTATLISGTVIWATPVFAQPRAQVRPLQLCGVQALTGRAPDVMTYDPKSGTQVFLNPGAQTSVTAYNPDTRSVAHMSGDLSKHGTADMCSVDGTKNGNAVSVQQVGDKTIVTGRNGTTGDTFQTDGDRLFSHEHDCFKAGLGLFAGTRRDMAVVGPAVAGDREGASVGVALGDRMLGLSARDGQVALGLSPC